MGSSGDIERSARYGLACGECLCGKMKERRYKQNKHKGKIADSDRTVVLSHTSVKHIEESLRSSSYSVHMRREMMRTLAEVPVISMSAVNQYAKILHYTLTSQRIQTSDFIFQNEATRLLTMGKSRKIRYSIRVLSGLCRMKN